MKEDIASRFTDNSPVPPVAPVPRPDYPARKGVAATSIAVLMFVAMFCVFQYWLLTATLEAYHSGDDDLPLGAFIASAACFVCAAALTILDEVALAKQQDYLRKNTSAPVKDRGFEPPVNSQTYTGAPPPSQTMNTEAGGGDAG